MAYGTMLLVTAALDLNTVSSTAHSKHETTTPSLLSPPPPGVLVRTIPVRLNGDPDLPSAVNSAMFLTLQTFITH